MKKIKEFYNTNKVFVLAMVAGVVLSAAYETANILLGFFPDKGAGYVFTAVCAVLLVGSFIYEKYFQKK